MISLKTSQEIKRMKEGGNILAMTLRALKDFALARYSRGDLTGLVVNEEAERLLQQAGVAPSFRGYSYPGSHGKFPTAICLSLNEEVVHGIPDKRILKEGDIVSIDLGVFHKGLHTDAAISFILGEGSAADEKLLQVTEEALSVGIDQIRIGNKIGAIGHAIERFVVPCGYSLVQDYAGHGVGHAIHEEPAIPNYGSPDEGTVIKEGMVLALEPMVLSGKEEVVVRPNGWTVAARDGARAAHFEHTVAVTKNGAVVLTK